MHSLFGKETLSVLLQISFAMIQCAHCCSSKKCTCISTKRKNVVFFFLYLKKKTEPIDNHQYYFFLLFCDKKMNMEDILQDKIGIFSVRVDII